MGESQENETGADPNASSAAPVSDAARIQETFSRVMQKVKSAYHKELQRKKQVDLTASVDIMRNRNMDETNETESNEDDEQMQAMTKVHSVYCIQIPSMYSNRVLLYSFGITGN